MRFLDLEIVTPSAQLPVTAEEFIDHARLNGLTVDRQPELLDRELTAATRKAEEYLRISLITQTLRALYLADDLDYPEQGVMLVLPRGKVQSVKSVVVDGTLQDPTTYTLAWNAVLLQSAYGRTATVEFVSGYGDDPEDVPATIREGILEYATMMYEDRSGARPSRSAQTVRGLPAGVQDIWRPFQAEAVR